MILGERHETTQPQSKVLSMSKRIDMGLYPKNIKYHTLPETNIAPEIWPYPKRKRESIPTIHF